MIEHKLISEEELNNFNPGETLAGRAKALLASQEETWDFFRISYESVRNAKTRTFEFEGYVIKAQHNPGRMTSTSAKVDDISIAERECFLCIDHLPEEQKALKYDDTYFILSNPHPIFPQHFTIPRIIHEEQSIINNFSDMLNISESFSEEYTIIYNGPKCGASAPDHMHFQAGKSNFLPIEKEYNSITEKHGEIICQNENLIIKTVDNYLRRFISFESCGKKDLIQSFEKFYKIFKEFTDSTDEPMMNILASHYGANWRVIIFPRSRHRPTNYYKKGEDKILLSPASLDLGGVCILPREEDFDKITKKQIVDIFHQVTLSRQNFESIKKRLNLELRE